MNDGLHIYPSSREHEEVNIVGTHDSLRMLRDSLTAALDRNCAKKTSFFANDGEGYLVCIVPVDPGAFGEMAEHYAYPRSRDAGCDVSGKWPDDLKIDWARA